MRPILRVRLLGDFRVTNGRTELDLLHGRRRRALLAYLLLHRDAPVSRQRVSFLFWPDSTEAQARTNLRQLLHHVRRALPEPDRFLRSEGTTLRWPEDAPAEVDVHRLEDARAGARRAGERGDEDAELDHLRRGAELYRGDLLPACYERWIEPDRERLRRHALRGLERLVELLERRRDYAGALRYAGRIRDLDPLREGSWRTLMRLHAVAGEPAKALEVFGHAAARLERELGVAPGTETVELRDRLAAGRDPGGDPRPASPEPRLPLVGRHEEWNRLLEAWSDLDGSGPRLVLLSGEPGIGKSHLAAAFRTWAERQGIRAPRADCHAAEGSLPYDPAAQWLRSRTLHPNLRRLDPARIAELARLLPELRPAGSGSVAPGAGEESWRRPRLFEALSRAVLAAGEPVILVLEDLHWCDGDTVEWLHYLLRFDPGAPLLLLATLRRGEVPLDDRMPAVLEALRGAGRLVEIALGPLDRDRTGELAEAVRGRPLGEPELAALHRETEGNPLFVVETLRVRPGGPFRPRGGGAGRTAAAGPGPAHSGTAGTPLPGRVRAVIRLRLEQLSPVGRSALELAATVGRTCSHEILREAAADDEERLVAGLDELVERHLLRERDGLTYRFSHDRIREVAYESVSAARRALLHRRVAEALERLHGADDAASGIIAAHLERAGLEDRAIPHYRRAADRALQVYANEEAAAWLQRALRALERRPDTPERAARELDLRIAHGVPLVAMHHYSGARVWETYHRARKLADRLGRPPEPPVLRALALAGLMRSRTDDVLELAGRLRSVAERADDPMLGVEAHYLLGVARFWRGELRAARQHLERALADYDPERARSHLRLYSQDPGVVCRVRLGLALWHLGHGEEGRRTSLAAVADAERLGHPFTLVYARYFASWTLAECGDVAEAERQVRALRRESADRGLRVWPTMAALQGARLRMLRNGLRRELDRMLDAAERYRAHGVSLGLPYHECAIAEAWRRTGSPERGLGHLDTALAMSRDTGERFWDAELHRMRGEILRETGAGSDRVEECFHRALEVARAQDSRALELRAEGSLAGARDG